MNNLYTLQTRCAKTKSPEILEQEALKISGQINDLETERERAMIGRDNLNGKIKTGFETGLLSPRRLVELETIVQEQERLILACDQIISSQKQRLRETERFLEGARSLTKQLQREIEERLQMIDAGEKELTRVVFPVKDQDRPRIEQQVKDYRLEIEQIEALTAEFLQSTNHASISG